MAVFKFVLNELFAYFAWFLLCFVFVFLGNAINEGSFIIGYNIFISIVIDCSIYALIPYAVFFVIKVLLFLFCISFIYKCR